MDLAREGNSSHSASMVMAITEKRMDGSLSVHRAQRSSAPARQLRTVGRVVAADSHKRKHPIRGADVGAAKVPKTTAAWRQLLNVTTDTSQAGLKAAFERIVLREWRPSAARLKALALAYEGLLQSLECQSSSSLAADVASEAPPGVAQISAIEHKRVRWGIEEREMDTKMSRLHVLLRYLDPQRRREVITTQLTQQQRLALEAWILRQSQYSRPLALAHRPLSVSACECDRKGAYIWRVNGSYYGACVHIAGGIYAQSRWKCTPEDAVHSLAQLIALRSRCAGGSIWAQLSRLDVSTKAMLASGKLDEGSIGFRGRFSLGKSLRLSTPLRFDAREAVQDLESMATAARAFALSASLSLQQKRDVHKTWLAIWEARGRSISSMEAQRVEKALQMQGHQNAKTTEVVLQQISGLLQDDPQIATKKRKRQSEDWVFH